jgi:hypothetical protein
LTPWRQAIASFTSCGSGRRFLYSRSFFPVILLDNEEKMDYAINNLMGVIQRTAALQICYGAGVYMLYQIT